MKKVQQLLSKGLDVVNRRGTFKYRNENDNEWTVVEVSLSPLLCSRIQNPKLGKYNLNAGVEYYDTVFATHMQSKNYADSPFRLVQFIPSKGSDIPAHAHLECVDESGKTIIDAFTGKVAGYENAWRRASSWTRHEVRKNIKMLSDTDISSIVDPNPRFIPVLEIGKWRVKQ